ncbi:MAG: hypothetical protein KatS3mg124_2392 [Porticoccaceae bacterium]|nr:MAG: hypothetical protein KatS3mg124_2392 [Porticoccaceae bacterium]
MRVRILAASALVAASPAFAADTPSPEELWRIIQAQSREIEALKARLAASESQIQETRVIAASAVDAVEAQQTGAVAGWADRTTLGGYGEHHYNNFEAGDDQVDAHRFVLFLGHQFDDSVRFFSELEVEHGLTKDTADGSGPGEVELEQAYIRWDFAERHALVMGQFLVPVGILNETHEPDTFYGTERNRIESNIIPTTWWETGVMLTGELLPGLSYDAALHSGLKTAEGGAVRGGRQKSAKAVANDPAYTVRLKYTGLPGLELAATAQYQSDLTQGRAGEDADGTLLEAHAILSRGPFALRALWASWEIDGAGFAATGRDEQRGWFLEPSYKPLEQLGFFVRYGEYDNEAGLSSSQATQVWDYGLNWWLHPRVVVKADVSDVEDGNDSLNLGLGWSF